MRLWWTLTLWVGRMDAHTKVAALVVTTVMVTVLVLGASGVLA